MIDVNKVILLGRVGQDPKISNGCARFSVATNNVYTDNNGVKQEKTTWTDVVCFGKRADFIDRSVHKGAGVYIEGRGESGEYTNRDGIKVRTWEVHLQTISLLPSANRESQQDARPSQDNRSSQQASRPSQPSRSSAPSYGNTRTGGRTPPNRAPAAPADNSHGDGGFSDDDDFPE